MTKDYITLQGNFTEAITGEKVGFSTSDPINTFATFDGIWRLGYFIIFVLIIGAIIYGSLKGGVFSNIFEPSSGVGLVEAKKWYGRALFGALFAILIYLIPLTFYPEMLRANISFSNLFAGSGGRAGGGGASGSFPSPSAPSKACVPKESVLSAISSGNVCAGVSCSALSGCNYQKYLPIIQSESSRLGVDPKLVIVTMCKESKADPRAQNKNDNNTFDCGLMQVNQPTACDASSLDISKNITAGIVKLKLALASANQVYPGVPTKAGVFATYNCCSNGTVPNAQSVDCNPSSGFSTPIPKWACPINPGDSKSNMCAVKAYACELNACLESLN